MSDKQWRAAFTIEPLITMKSSTGRQELDAKVVNIELTLTSIIQGVALYFLADNTRVVLAEGRWTAWPYVATGLLIILLFWARSLIHTLTLIRWPIEFVHNFFYFGCVLLEVLAFTRLRDPFLWFVMNAIFAAVVWGLFVYDLRMVYVREIDSVGDAGCRLYAIVERDQWLNIYFLIPAIFLFNLGCALAIHTDRELFLARNGHLIFIAGEAVGLVGYLVYVIRSFIKLAPLIAATHQEWREANGTSGEQN